MSSVPDAAASRLTDIFIRVLQAEPARREGLIRELCGGDAALTRDITELVAAAERAPSTAGMMRDVLSADEPPPLAPGTEIRGYTIERLIASGGMGVVYLARDIALDMQVAIKALKPSIAGDAEHRRRLKHEAQLMAQLAGHPNIATVHALIDEGDALYIVEECLPGPTLREHLAHGPLPVSEAIGVGRRRAPRARRRAPAEHRAPRPEAGERDADVRGQVEGARLRHREAPGARPADDAASARGRTSGSARRCTCRPSSCGASPSTAGPTCSRSASCFTSCSRGRHPFTQRGDLGGACPRGRRS